MFSGLENRFGTKCEGQMNVKSIHFLIGEREGGDYSAGVCMRSLIIVVLLSVSSSLLALLSSRVSKTVIKRAKPRT